MKIRGLIIFVVFIGINLNAVLAQDVPTDRHEIATVYVYRSYNYVASLRKYWICVNGRSFCKLANKQRCKVELPIVNGPVTVSTKLAGLSLVPKKQPHLLLNLEGGKTYYLQGDLEINILPFQAILNLTEIVPDTIKSREVRQADYYVPQKPNK